MIIEKLICDYLSNKLNITALPEKPNRPYDNKVFVERAGGTGSFLKETTIAIQSYGETKYNAATLNDLVIATMLDIVELGEVTEISLNSNYDFTDTDTKEYRYQAVFDIVHY